MRSTGDISHQSFLMIPRNIETFLPKMCIVLEISDAYTTLGTAPLFADVNVRENV